MGESFLFEAVRRPQLFKAIFAFNRLYCPKQEIPSSLLALGSPGKKLWSDPAIRGMYLQEKYSCPGYWDFADEASRLVLLDKEVFKSLLRYFSSAVLSERIAHVLERSRLMELRSSLGSELYQYVLRRGRYQVGSIRDYFLPFAEGTDVEEQISGISSAAVLTVSSDWSRELLDFLEKHDPGYFSFAREKVASLENGASRLAMARPDQKRSLWATLKKILLKEVAPEWAPCFD